MYLVKTKWVDGCFPASTERSITKNNSIPGLPGNFWSALDIFQNSYTNQGKSPAEQSSSLNNYVINELSHKYMTYFAYGKDLSQNQLLSAHMWLNFKCKECVPFTMSIGTCRSKSPLNTTSSVLHGDLWSFRQHFHIKHLHSWIAEKRKRWAHPENEMLCWNGNSMSAMYVLVWAFSLFHFVK